LRYLQQYLIPLTFSPAAVFLNFPPAFNFPHLQVPQFWKLAQNVILGPLKPRQWIVVARGNDCHRDKQFLRTALFYSSPRVTYGNQPKVLVSGDVCQCFDVLLTVHLSIILVINLHNAQIFVL
jgi:hypothetical protein